MAYFITLMLLPIASLKSYAEDTTTVRYPTVVLYQLRSEHNRISALLRNKDPEEAAFVDQEAKEVIKRVHLDFKNNFKYCPVYYYMDTNADLIKKRVFNGVLLNDKGEFVNDVIPAGNNNAYVIAYYGYALSQAKYTDEVEDTNEYLNNPQLAYQMDNKTPLVKKSTKYKYDSDPPNGKGLVILNPKFRQLTYFYKIGFDEYKFNRGKNVGPTHYRSKKYDIEYYPFAKNFNVNMFGKYGNRRILMEKINRENK
jgi:hypothetical protein